MSTVEKDFVEREAEAEECAAALLLEIQSSSKSRGDALKVVVKWLHHEFGQGTLSLTLMSGSNYTAAAKKELSGMFGLPWKETADFEIYLDSTKVVSRRQQKN